MRAFITAAVVGALVGSATAQPSPPTSQPTSTPATQPAVAPAPAAKPAPRPPEHPFSLTSRTLTGDWGGVRTQLEDIGITLRPLLFASYDQNYKGGERTHHAAVVPWLGQYIIELDFGKMKLIPGGSFYMHTFSSWSDGIKPFAGSLEHPYWVTGSSGNHPFLVDKWWYRQDFFNDRIELRLGKLLTAIDLVDTNEYAGNCYLNFNHQSLVNNGVVPVSKGLGAYLRVKPTDWLYFFAAAMDPDQKPGRSGFDTAFHGPDHFRGYWELGLTPKWESAKGPMPGNYRFGCWYDPQSKLYFEDVGADKLATTYRSGDTGFYMNFDQLVWKENSDPKDKQGLGVFGRYGFADGHVNTVENFWSAARSIWASSPTVTTIFSHSAWPRASCLTATTTRSTPTRAMKPCTNSTTPSR